MVTQPQSVRCPSSTVQQKTDIHSVLEEAVRAELVERSTQLVSLYPRPHSRSSLFADPGIVARQGASSHRRLLAAHTPPEKREEAIFEIVNQLNRGAALITSLKEREHLAEFNLIAGMRAKAATAYAPALTYLAAGAAALPEDAWSAGRNSPSRLSCTGPTASSGQARCRPWRSVSRRLQRALSTRSNERPSQAAVWICTRCSGPGPLCRGGPGMPSACGHRLGGASHRAGSASRVRADLVPARKPRDRGPHRPAADAGSGVSATLDVLTALGPPTLYTDGHLYALTSCRAINLSLERGNSDAAPAHYASVGLMAGDRFGDYDAGYRLAKMGCDLTERPD